MDSSVWFALGASAPRSIHKIQFGAVEDTNSHETRSLICFFAVSQSVNPTSPDSARCDRSSRMRLCQSVGEYTSFTLDRSDQSASIIPVFSETVTSFNGNAIFMAISLVDSQLRSSDAVICYSSPLFIPFSCLDINTRSIALSDRDHYNGYSIFFHFID